MMTKTNSRRVAMTIAVLMAVLVMVACVPWFVVRAGGTEDTVVPEPTPTGLMIMKTDGTIYTGKIKFDGTRNINVTVTLTDPRNISEGATPKVTLNTESFTIQNPLENIIVTKEGTNITVKFNNLTYTGVGKKLEFNLFYLGQDEKAVDVPLYTYTATLNQCVEYVAPPPPEPVVSTPEPDSSEPLVIGTGFALKSVDFGGSEVMAGTSFNLNLTLIATSGTYSVNNVAVAVTPSEQFSIAAGASNIYIGTVRPGATVPVTVPLTPSATVAAGSYPVVMSVSGVNAHDGASVNAEITVTIPIAQPERFEISNVQAPSMLTAGMDDGSGFTSVTLVNKGKGTIYNVSVNVVGEGLSSSEGPQFIGNIAAGSENGADLTVLAATPGSIDGQIVVTYENEKGEEKTLTHSFTVDVQDMGMMDPGMGMDPMMPIEPPPENQGIPYWFWIILGVGAVTAVVITVAVVKKRRAKKAAALDDDFDEDRE